MARVTPEEVKEIIDTELTDIYAFIQTANILVTDLLVNKGIDVDRLKEIERWLSAHFLAMRDQDAGMTTGQTIGDTKVFYSRNSGKGLNLSRYGQQAMVLDSTGTLAALNRKRARLTVVTTK